MATAAAIASIATPAMLGLLPASSSPPASCSKLGVRCGAGFGVGAAGVLVATGLGLAGLTGFAGAAGTAGLAGLAGAAGVSSDFGGVKSSGVGVFGLSLMIV